VYVIAELVNEAGRQPYWYIVPFGKAVDVVPSGKHAVPAEVVSPTVHKLVSNQFNISALNVGSVPPLVNVTDELKYAWISGGSVVKKSVVSPTFE